MTESLEGHVAVVTGASSGIGCAIALALASRGVALGLVGRSRERLTAVRARAAAETSRAASYVTDLTSDDALQELAEQVRRDFDAIDILVHCAGVFTRGLVREARVDELDTQYRTNLRAPYAVTRLLLPLVRPDRGQIVFVNSTAGLRASAGVASYGVMKHGLRALADALRDEVNEHGIRVLSVFIGRSATPMQADVHRLEGRPYRPEHLLQPDDVASVVLHALSMPRTAEITDITVRPLKKTAG